jgi:hypothetical protein
MFFIFNLNYLFCSDDYFMSRFEYGSMLYKDPRGIGCHHCHGLDARGSLLVTYKKKLNNRLVDINITVPSIDSIDFNRFKAKLTNKSKKSLIMPTYSLTIEEIITIHYYITNL